MIATIKHDDDLEKGLVPNAVQQAKDRLRQVQQRIAAVRADIEARTATITAELEQLRALRKASIVADQPRGDRYEHLAEQVAAHQAALRQVEEDLQDLLDAEPELQERVRRTQERERVQMAHRLHVDKVAVVRKLNAVLREAEKLNHELLRLDAASRELGEISVSDKAMLLITRSGSAWSALNPQHVGQTITLAGWRQHVRTLIDME